MIMTRILSVLCLLTSFFSGFTQNLSNKGKEFWVGYGHHQFFEDGGSQYNIQNLVIYLSAEQPATVTVSLNGTSYSATYSIPANSVISTPAFPKAGSLDARLWNSTTSEGLFNKGIRILSDVPIVAYAHIYGSASSGATMLMPVNTWGYNYISVNSEQRYSGNNCFSWLYVIAKEDNTKVTITPTVPTRGGKPANVPFDVVLNKGQIYQVLGALVDPNSSTGEGHQLTGTTIKSIPNSDGVCKAIAVFSGSSRTRNPVTSCGSGSGGDNDMQQLFPSQAWGKRYLTAPTSRSTSASAFMMNSYKIVVKDPNTEVYRNGVQLTGLINNTYYHYESGTADYIESNKPIMVAQYMTGGTCLGGGVGDPEMIYISPIEQGIKRIGFYRNTLQNITVNYLTLIIPNLGVNSLTIDGTGASGFSHTYPHPNLPGYTIVIKRWTASQSQCIVQSDSAFTAITYGLGSVESYGFNAGTLINNLNVIGNVHNALDTTTNTHQFTCRNTPAELSMYVAYKPTNMFWNLSQVANISPNADVNISNPVPKDSMLQNGTWYYRYELPGNYVFSDTGTYDIPVRNTHNGIENCNNTEEVSFSVEVKMNPVADFSFTHTGCIADSVHFLSPANTGNGYTVGAWQWSFADGSQSSDANPVKLLGTTGLQDIQLNVITTEGCVGDTIKPIEVFARPSADFGVTPASICEGGSISFTDTSNYGGPSTINQWYWDYGNGLTDTLTDGNAHSITYPGYGTYTVKHVVKVTDACVSDTITKLVNVYAKPIININYPAGCLPSDGVIQFNNTTSTPDNQVLNHTWDFGDGNANSANPNTSTAQNPTHTYSIGTYTINYSATTANGCTIDTSFTTTFNIKPLLSYAAVQNSVCESVEGTVSVAGGTVTNGVSGNGFYMGVATDSSGNFNPSIAGAGTHTVWYVFNSDGGCRDSLSTTIKVHPKPVPGFTVDADICLDQTATFTNTSSIASGNITGWYWNFGDGNTATYDNGNSFTRFYPSHNTYTIQLAAISDSSCVSDTFSQVINVHPLPVADFTLPASICMPNGQAAFVNTSSVADQSALSYQWNFGDGGNSVSANPNYTYYASGPYNVSLIATTAYGCMHDTVKVLDAFYDKPVAQFSVTPDTLCQGADNEFTDLSTAPNSNIASWNWDFGDGSNSTSNEPVKNYSQPGNYSVTLTVKNDAGCTSDPFSDNVIVYLQPVISAGPSFIVPQGTAVTFNPTANDSTVLNFMWTPAGNFADPTVLRPTVIANYNQTYTLTATGQGNCTATDTLTVKILKPVKVPNSFSPNGDGINDQWLIPNLGEYPGCTVEVFNRYGMMVYKSSGYGTPWNGTYKGNPLPFGTYYYVINLKNGFAPVTGSVTIVK